MYNQQFPSLGGHNEPYERLIKHLEAEYPLSELPASEEQRQIEYLLDLGFDCEEALNLIDMREHLYESDEMCERIANDSRMHFVRWLYENGEIHEN